MENETKVDGATNPSEEVATEQETTTEEAVETPKTYSEKEFKEVVARAKRAEASLKTEKSKPPVVKTSLDVDDYINISASLDGLDQKEKAKLAKEHQITGKPLAEIRNDEDFVLWQSAYRAKKATAEASITPSTKQPDDNSPISLEDALNNASTIAEKEAILAQMGYTIGKSSSAATRVKLG